MLKRLQDYGAACQNASDVLKNASIVVPVPSAADLTLSDGPSWNGPFGQGLNTGATVFGVVIAFVLGLGAITVVNTM